MRGVMPKDWWWTAKIEYKNYQDSILHIHSSTAPDIFRALAEVHSSIKACWPYEIIELKQEILTEQSSAGEPQKDAAP